jgi:hypothetical protein
MDEDLFKHSVFYDGLVGLHSLIRWLILILLLVNIVRSLVYMDDPYSPTDKKWNIRLLIVAHINLLTGLVQYFFGPKGFVYFIDEHNYSVGEVMKSPAMRFWAVEHILLMIIAVALITISRGVSKKPLADTVKKKKRLTFLYVFSLLIILAAIPWPFRQGLETTPYFRGLY